MADSDSDSDMIMLQSSAGAFNHKCPEQTVSTSNGAQNFKVAPTVTSVCVSPFLRVNADCVCRRDLRVQLEDHRVHIHDGTNRSELLYPYGFRVVSRSLWVRYGAD